MSLCSINSTFALACVLWVASANAVAAPTLHCRIEQAGTVRDLQFSAVSNPYAVEPVDIGKRFRFKAVMVGNAQKIDYINLYTYYVSSGEPVLMHQVKYLEPQVQGVGEGAGSKSLTGLVYLYSPVLMREIQYECSLREKTS